jgi:hypothetical protein
VSGSVNWGLYDFPEPPVRRPLEELTSTEAKAYFQWFVAHESDRYELVRRFLAAHGVEFEANEAKLRVLMDWINSSVTVDSNSGALPEQWYSLLWDIGVALSAEVRRHFPTVDWQLDKAKKSVSCNRPVLRGFQGVSSRRYSVDWPSTLITWGNYIAAKGPLERGRLWNSWQAAARLV